MNGHPVRARVADVVAEGPAVDGRGSGYLVADGWVLTAQHVVAGAAKVAVWLGAPARLGPDGRRDVDLTSALLDEGSDLALLPVTVDAESPVEPALLGRLDRDAAAPVPVVAAGCPRFKLRAGPTRGKLLRELHEAHGTVAARSNTKTGTYEMADLRLSQTRTRSRACTRPGRACPVPPCGRTSGSSASWPSTTRAKAVARSPCGPWRSFLADPPTVLLAGGRCWGRGCQIGLVGCG